MELIQELRHKAARGENLTSGGLLEVAEALEGLQRRNHQLVEEGHKLRVQIGVLQELNATAYTASASSRSIDHIREDVTSEDIKAGSYLYNAYEVRQIIKAHDNRLEEHSCLKNAYEDLHRESTLVVGLAQTIADVDAGNVRPFAFQDVAALVQSMRDKTMLGRPMRNNVREVFQLLKAQPNALFYGSELKMVREWGTDHDRNLSIVKSRLGRAFTDPVGYMDTRFDLMLSKATKRQLLDGRVLTAQAYQHAVFARPDFLQIKPDWKLHDGKTQFHAGEHFHTRACDGMWWCGTHFNDLTGHQLMNILETALGELRLLYIHFPNGVTNEEPAK